MVNRARFVRTLPVAVTERGRCGAGAFERVTEGGPEFVRAQSGAGF